MATYRGSPTLERRLKSDISLYESAAKVARTEGRVWGETEEHWREVVRVLTVALNSLPTTERYARLFAAAPEMEAKLKFHIETFRLLGDSRAPIPNDIRQACVTFAAELRVLLAKIKGET